LKITRAVESKYSPVKTKSMKAITGGELMVMMLKEEGVEKVFGIIDGTYFGFYSNLKKYGIDLITPRHETTAVHMAGAYARLTGRLGVCMASNGPGVANALPGVAVEQGEGNRVLLITSSRRTGIIYPDRGGTFQYFNQTAVIGAMSKLSLPVPDFNRIPEMARKAFRKCWQGRPGVVHLEIPENIMNGKHPADGIRKPRSYRRTAPIVPPPEQVKAAAAMLMEARFPIIHAGSGVVHSGAFDALQKVAHALHAPVTTSWGARGALPETDELSIPMRHIELNNQVRNEADAVLVLGSRLGETDWWGKPPYWAPPATQKMIQVDIEEDILGANKPATLPILSDVEAFLTALIPLLGDKKASPKLASRQAQLEKFKVKQQRHERKLNLALKDFNTPIHSAQVVHICQDFFPEDAVCVADGGNTVVWANFYTNLRIPNTFLSTYKFGMLGAGIGQALGAAVARPDKPVYCLIGDGAMGYHSQELETAIRNGLKVVFIVFCDKQWGMVKINQQFALRPLKTMIKKSLDPSETINTDLGEIEFDKLAESMGAHGERISSPEELNPALQRCLASNKCAVIHAGVDPVKHMWAPSLIYFKKMHEEPGG
jgi:acetolactate synthase I/II/III large subunit